MSQNNTRVCTRTRTQREPQGAKRQRDIGRPVVILWCTAVHLVLGWERPVDAISGAFLHFSLCTRLSPLHLAVIPFLPSYLPQVFSLSSTHSLPLQENGLCISHSLIIAALRHYFGRERKIIPSSAFVQLENVTLSIRCSR